MATVAAKRRWRKVDLAEIQRDQPIRRRLHHLWAGENFALPACLFAVLVVGMVYGFLNPNQLGTEIVVAIVLGSPILGLAVLIYLTARLQRHGPTTVIGPDPGYARSIWAVVGVEVYLVVVYLAFGSEPWRDILPFLALLLCFNTLMVLGIRMFTERLRARLLADPEVARVLVENRAAVGSGAYQTSRAARVSAWSEAQRASSHQDLALARRARLKNWLLAIPAGILFILLTFARTGGLSRFLPGATFTVTGLVVILALAGAGIWLYQRIDSKRETLAGEVKVQTVPSAQYALQQDHRPPILLLRSFVDDAARNGYERFEETIAPWFLRYGPVVAIGDPKDSVPDFGAYRDYVSDDAWQERARVFIRSADLIVMVPGQTHWIRWELGEILDADCLHKTLFVFPPGLPIAEKTARLAATWEAFSQREELQPLESADLAQTVAMHFFVPDAITRITDDAFASASRYTYDRALFAALTDR